MQTRASPSPIVLWVLLCVLPSFPPLHSRGSKPNEAMPAPCPWRSALEAPEVVGWASSPSESQCVVELFVLV